MVGVAPVQKMPEFMKQSLGTLKSQKVFELETPALLLEMSGAMEDTMDVDEDMRMDEDPSGTPMSTDEDTSQGTASKVVDDVMASPTNECPTEMEADITSPPPLEAAPKPQVENGNTGDGQGVAPIPATGDEPAEDLDRSGSTPGQAEPTSEAEERQNTSRDDEDGEGEGVEDNSRPSTNDRDNDPLLESNSNSRTELSQKETSDMTNASVSEDGQDPSEVTGNENSNNQINVPPSTDNSNQGRSLADELAEARSESPSPKPPSSEKGNNEKSLADELAKASNKSGDKKDDEGEDRDGKQQDADHISLSGSSAAGGDDDAGADAAVDHVSIAGSSEAEEGPVDHVSVDSDSEEENDAPKSQEAKDGKPSNITAPVDDAKSSKETVANAGEDRTVKQTTSEDQSNAPTTPQLQLKQITSLQSPALINTNEPPVELVVSDEETEGSTRPSSAGSINVASDKFKGSITLLGKQADSETIISDVPSVASDMTSEGDPPSLPNSSEPTSAVMTPEARVGASIKSHYSVKKMTNPIYYKCLHCALDQRCPWKVSIGAKYHYICSDKCMEEHRVQRRQILESGAPPVSTIIQIADLSTLEKKCAACQKTIPKAKVGSLTWEVMEFCDEDCLTSYQVAHTSKCCNCQTSVNTSSMGKYCVRFGHEVKQFCSPGCLDTYKKAIKTCSYCQKNLQDSSEGFLAAVGGKDQFRDFCSQDCLEKYDCICNNSCASFSVENCVVCDNTKVTFYELLTGDKVAALCSDVCLAAYKFVNNIQVGVCGMCNKYYDKNGVDESITFNNETPSSFCTKHCMNISVISKRKIVPCAWCKAKKYNFDMIFKRGATEDESLFVCSVNCLALHNVSLKALPSQKIVCAYCKKYEVSTYHLTMSDATVRHFCSYDCVLAFQAPFNTTVAASNNVPVPTGAPKKVPVGISPAATPMNTSPVNTGPTIQSVGTLKPLEPPPLIPTSALKQQAQSAASVTVSGVGGSRMKQTTLKIPSSFCLKPPDMKNKWTQITVCTLSKCVSCRPKKEDQGFQCSLGEGSLSECAAAVSAETPTENGQKSTDGSNKVFIPIPVPIYIPYPVAMYTLPSPVPLAVPVPLVVPVLVPTALDNMDQVIETMRDILEKSGKNVSTSRPSVSSPDGCHEETQNSVTGSRKRGFRDDESGDNEKPIKKARFADDSDDGEDTKTEQMKLKYALGISAWKHFVKRWNESVDDDQPDCQRLKADILEMRPPELSSALALFVREAKKDNGSPYRPDLKFYLTLGIQYYLFRNERADDIFGDAMYEEFTDALDVEAQKFQLSDESPVSRVEEKHLWESMQIGAKSPQTVLLTLVYFITLHFNLWTIEEHMQLSFASFVKTNKSASSSSRPSDTKVIRLSLNSASGDSADKKQGVYELVENKQDPLKCPVRLFEFYLTKCPGNVTSHVDRFYLMPEASCFPESPVWYRTLALPPQAIEKMLNRVKLIKEICDARNELLNQTADDPVV